MGVKAGLLERVAWWYLRRIYPCRCIGNHAGPALAWGTQCLYCESNKIPAYSARITSETKHEASVV